MRKYSFLICFFLLFPFMPCLAWDYDQESISTTHSMQLRASADFTKKWQNGLSLEIAEDVRFYMVDNTILDGKSTLNGPSFDKAYTSLTLGYRPIEYVKVDVGYMLKIMGDKDWSKVKKWMRHRVFFSVTGTYRYAQWSFSLRERFMSEIRMSNIDIHEATGLAENNRADWHLRSKIEVAYHAMSKPLKPYIWFELANTLNANTLQQKYTDNNPDNNDGHQYIKHARTAIGIVWKLNSQSSLDFYYRFDYGYEHDVDVIAKTQALILTEKTELRHAIGVAYKFDW